VCLLLILFLLLHLLLHCPLQCLYRPLHLFDLALLSLDLYLRPSPLPLRAVRPVPLAFPLSPGLPALSRLLPGLITLLLGLTRTLTRAVQLVLEGSKAFTLLLRLELGGDTRVHELRELRFKGEGLPQEGFCLLLVPLGKLLGVFRGGLHSAAIFLEGLQLVSEGITFGLEVLELGGYIGG